MKYKKTFFIGIIEENNNTNTKQYIEEFFLQEEWKIIYRTYMNNISVLKKSGIIVFVVQIDPLDVHLYNSIGIRFNILVYNAEEIIARKFLECDYFILNSDGENWLSLPLGNLRPLAVSYGFNNKATLTVSSYNDDHNTKLNLCLQREIISIVGSKIEPFEFTINLKTTREKEKYKILAAATTSLVFGNKKPHFNIKI